MCASINASTSVLEHARVYVLVPCCYKCGCDLVMLTWNKPEVIVVLVLVIILRALLGPRTPTVAVVPERFWHALDFPIHEELVR